MKKLILAFVLCFALCLCSCGSDTDPAHSKEVTKEETSVDVSGEQNDDRLASDDSSEISADLSSEDSSEESFDVTSSEDESADDEVAEQSLRDFLSDENVKNDDNLIAVAHLGVCEGDYDAVKAFLEEKGVYEMYPFLSAVKEDSFFAGEGPELYAIILLRDDAILTVSKDIIDDSTTDEDGVPLIKREELYTGQEISPIIVRGNYSDIIPELSLTVTIDTELALECSPHLSLENGMLGNNDHVGGVYDFTPYSLLGIATSAAVVGNWYSQVQYDADTHLALLLDFYDHGEATYGYGPVDAGFIGKFTGYWTVDGDVLSLDFDTVIDEEGEQAFDYHCTFRFTVDGDKLTLVHIDGESLLDTMKGATFEFTAGQR